MTKPKSTPAVTTAAGPTEVASPTHAVAQAEADKADGKEVSVTTTGRVQVETNIKVEDFSDGGSPAPDVYSREPEVEAINLGNGRFIENYA